MYNKLFNKMFATLLCFIHIIFSGDTFMTSPNKSLSNSTIPEDLQKTGENIFYPKQQSVLDNKIKINIYDLLNKPQNLNDFVSKIKNDNDYLKIIQKFPDLATDVMDKYKNDFNNTNFNEWKFLLPAKLTKSFTDFQMQFVDTNVQSELRNYFILNIKNSLTYSTSRRIDSYDNEFYKEIVFKMINENIRSILTGKSNKLLNFETRLLSRNIEKTSIIDQLKKLLDSTGDNKINLLNFLADKNNAKLVKDNIKLISEKLSAEFTTSEIINFAHMNDYKALFVGPLKNLLYQKINGILTGEASISETVKNQMVQILSDRAFLNDYLKSAKNTLTIDQLKNLRLFIIQNNSLLKFDGPADPELAKLIKTTDPRSFWQKIVDTFKPREQIVTSTQRASEEDPGDFFTA